jgi:hypothetical protein
MRVTGERLNFNYKDVIKGKNMDQNIYLKPGDHHHRPLRPIQVVLEATNRERHFMAAAQNFVTVTRRPPTSKTTSTCFAATARG